MELLKFTLDEGIKEVLVEALKSNVTQDYKEKIVQTMLDLLTPKYMIKKGENIDYIK